MTCPPDLFSAASWTRVCSRPPSAGACDNLILLTLPLLQAVKEVILEGSGIIQIAFDWVVHGSTIN